MTQLRILKPETPAEVADIIRDAGTNALAIEGNGSKRGLGRPMETDAVLKLSGLSGITMYEPDELVFTARAGTPLAEIERTLAERGQCLGFEPGECGKLWSNDAPGATIGGTVAAAISGPRRFAAGAARDHLLGFAAVNGKGEAFKAGGRVVKNVTGYDLSKLATGSFGTLFVMTELTMRAIPRGAAISVLVLECLSPGDALRVLRTIARSPFEPTALTFLPANVAARAGMRSQSLTLIRLEGQAEGVKAREAELLRTLANGARTADAALYRTLTDVHALFDAAIPLFRISVPPSNAMEAIEKLAPASWFADAAGAILWCAFQTLDAQGARGIHQTARELGGHATLYRAPDDLRSEVDVFPPLDTAAMVLTRQLKNAFDPNAILNPARMYVDA